MRGVKNTDDTLCLCGSSVSSDSSIENSSDGMLTLFVGFFQVTDGLSFPYVFIPDFLFQSLGSSFALKLLPTIQTSVVLNISSFSILLYLRFVTEKTLFLRMVVLVSSAIHTG